MKPRHVAPETRRVIARERRRSGARRRGLGPHRRRAVAALGVIGTLFDDLRGVRARRSALFTKRRDVFHFFSRERRCLTGSSAVLLIPRRTGGGGGSSHRFRGVVAGSSRRGVRRRVANHALFLATSKRPLVRFPPTGDAFVAVSRPATRRRTAPRPSSRSPRRPQHDSDEEERNADWGKASHVAPHARGVMARRPLAIASYS